MCVVSVQRLWESVLPFHTQVAAFALLSHVSRVTPFVPGIELPVSSMLSKRSTTKLSHIPSPICLSEAGSELSN